MAELADQQGREEARCRPPARASCLKPRKGRVAVAAVGGRGCTWTTRPACRASPADRRRRCRWRPPQPPWSRLAGACARCSTPRYPDPLPPLQSRPTHARLRPGSCGLLAPAAAAPASGGLPAPAAAPLPAASNKVAFLASLSMNRTYDRQSTSNRIASIKRGTN
jgi:hypothetical protein